MKLAEALNERADVQTRLSELSQRLQNNARVQEGSEPNEAPQKLLKELNELSIRLEELIIRINKTNSKELENGESLTILLAKRDVLKKKISILRSFLDSASNLVNNYSRSEIKVYSTVSVAEQRKVIDELSKEFRELDTRIQQLNWTIDLI